VRAKERNISNRPLEQLALCPELILEKVEGESTGEQNQQSTAVEKL
jgi:hypothetical protein